MNITWLHRDTEIQKLSLCAELRVCLKEFLILDSVFLHKDRLSLERWKGLQFRITDLTRQLERIEFLDGKK